MIAEGVVLVRAMRGRLSESEPARDLASVINTPVVELRGDGAFAGRLAAVYLSHLSRPHRVPGGTSLVVVQMSDPEDIDVGRAVLRGAELASERPTYVDLTSESPTTAPTGRSDTAPPGAVLRVIRRPTVDDITLELVRGSMSSVLVVDTARATRRDVVSAVSALNTMGADVIAVLVWIGRLPRRRSTSPLSGGQGMADGQADQARVPESVDPNTVARRTPI